MSVARSTTTARGCGGKIIYPSTKSATRACIAIKRRTGLGQSQAYWCQHCGGYHVGRKGGRNG